MAKECYITGRKNLSGNNRSFSMNATRKKWKANLQKVRIIDENGEKKTVWVSARALKKNNLTRA